MKPFTQVVSIRHARVHALTLEDVSAWSEFRILEASYRPWENVYGTRLQQ